MNADQLRTLIAVVREGSFERAAAHLHVTQSAVSQRIKALERAVGRPVLSRTSPVRPTQLGALVLRHATAVDILESELNETLENSVAENALEIVVNAESLALWFPEALAIAAKQTGRSFTVLRDDEGHTAERMKASGTIVAAVSADPHPAQGCTSTPLGMMQYRAVAAPAFAREWQLDRSLDRLGHAPVLHFDQKDSVQHRFLEQLGVTHSGRTHFIPSSVGFANAIATGLGWGLIPEEQFQSALPGTFVSLSPSLVTRPLFWHVWHIESPTLVALTDAVLSVAQTHLAQSR